MDMKTFNDFMQRRYQPALQRLKKRAYHNQRMYRWIQWSTIILSMVTAILVGTEQFFDVAFIKILALCTSVIVSGLATALTTFNFQEKSMLYNKSLTKLENEYDMYLVGSDAYAKVNDKELHFVQSVLRIFKEEVETIKDKTISHFFDEDEKGVISSK